MHVNLTWRELGLRIRATMESTIRSKDHAFRTGQVDVERRREISGKPKLVDEILAEGTKKAQRVARATLEKAKAAMKF